MAVDERRQIYGVEWRCRDSPLAVRRANEDFGMDKELVIVEDEQNEISADESRQDDFPLKNEYNLTFWQMLRRLFFQTRNEKLAEQQRRLSDLKLAILDRPDVAVNYMLRGEIYLEMKRYELAREDFNQAIALSEAQFENEKWGIAAQAIMDRAREGLRHTMRYLE
jgi:tetratricopeptide (TPR) repeat protein